MKKPWYEKASLRIIVITICGAVLLFFMIEGTLYRSLIKRNEADSKIHTSHLPSGSFIASNTPNRLIQYCNDEPAEGREGKLSADNLNLNWTLHHLLINIRHGDRSSIHLIPNAISLSTQVGDKQQQNYLDKRVHSFIPRLLSFTLVPMKRGVLPDALNVSSAFRTPDHSLKPGILTSKGFMQHVTLGKSLSNVYNQFLKKIKHRDSIFVRSTNYERTILSVAALLIGLLPNIGGLSIYSYMN